MSGQTDGWMQRNFQILREEFLNKYRMAMTHNLILWLRE